MLRHASANARHDGLAHLKEFFFAGVDARTEPRDLGDDIDVETQALISLSEAVKDEITRPRGHRPRPSVLPAALPGSGGPARGRRAHGCLSTSELIPRTVLVEYLKILFAFHLALYHLKIMKLLPAMVRDEENAERRRRVLPRRHRPADSAARPGSPSGAPQRGSAGYPASSGPRSP